MLLNTDFILPFQLEKFPVRGRFVRLGQVLDDILSSHNYPAAVNAVLTELMTLSASLTSFFKFEGVSTVQIKGDGPLPMMVADVTHDGFMRACAHFNKKKVSTLSGASLFSLVGNGHMTFTLDQNDAEERYQGIVDLQGTTLASCLQHFFQQSDQVDTRIVFFSRNKNNKNYQAAALIIQRMPAAMNLPRETIDEIEDRWHHCLSVAGTATDEEMLSEKLSAEDFLYRLFWESGVRVFEKKHLIAQCRCSQEKIESLLFTFSASDIKAIIKDNKINVNCEFCNKNYCLEPSGILNYKDSS